MNRNDYELLDASDGEWPERWGEVILIRPDSQIIWKIPHEHPVWKRAHIRHLRSNTGGGCWEEYHTVPGMWRVKYRGLTFQLKTTGSRHTGTFSEQVVNQDFAGEKIREADRLVKMLNLFGCTGAATLTYAPAGTEVCHMDASKGMVAWVRENVMAPGLSDKPVRWLVDDCVRFVQREQRRGNIHDGIIMDLLSYGRRSGGEVWRLEEQLYPLMQLCVPLFSKDTLFFVLNSYTARLSPSMVAHLLGTLLQTQFSGSVSVDEIGLPVTQSGLALPCGNTTIWAGQTYTYVMGRQAERTICSHAETTL